MTHRNGDGCIYEFGPFRLNSAERRLLRGDQLVALTPKVFDTLLVLIQHSGHVLKKDELMGAVWPDGFVEEINLAHNISVLRKALSGGEGDGAQTYIETVPKLGYRFVAPVQASPSPSGEGWGGVAARTNLPAQTTSFIGREGEISDLAARMKTTRLLTLTGAGGCGKTRLALEIAMRMVGATDSRNVLFRGVAPTTDDFRDGVWLVELASITDESLVPRAVGSIFGLADQPSTSPLEVLTNHLASKRLLLIVDNCEHLIGACAALIHHLLSNCRHLHVLATSREALRVAGEVNWRVPSLMTPDSAHHPPFEQALNFEAVRLFAERARAIQPGFDLSPRNVDAVISICHRLDGMPLAIELAAARVSSLSVEQIAQRLGTQFSLLTSGSLTALPRHQTLRAAIAWSVDLLTPTERVLLAHLSVFAGGFTSEAVEAVSGQPNTFDLLSNLVDKSLVIAEVRREAARYRLLETIRQYSYENLCALDANEEHMLRRRHLSFYLALAEEAEPRLYKAERAQWLARLEVEHDNFRMAVDWAFANGNTSSGLRLVAASGIFWNARGHGRERREQLLKALARSDPSDRTVIRALLLNKAAHVQWFHRNHEEARDLVAEALSIGIELGDQENIAHSFECMEYLAYSQRDFTTARVFNEKALALVQELGNTYMVAYTLSRHAELVRRQGDYDQAQSNYEEAIALFTALDEKMWRATTVRRLGRLALQRGDCAMAAALCQQSLKLNLEADDKLHTACCLATFAGLAVAQGQGIRAAQLFGAVEALLHEIGAPLLFGDVFYYEDDLAALRAQLDEATLAAAWARGLVMTLDEAVEFALSEAALQTGASR